MSVVVVLLILLRLFVTSIVADGSDLDVVRGVVAVGDVDPVGCIDVLVWVSTPVLRVTGLLTLVLALVFMCHYSLH